MVGGSWGAPFAPRGAATSAQLARFRWRETPTSATLVAGGEDTSGAGFFAVDSISCVMTPLFATCEIMERDKCDAGEVIVGVRRGTPCERPCVFDQQ